MPAMMSQRRKAGPWNSPSLWLPLGCWSSAGSFSFVCFSLCTSCVLSPMASASISQPRSPVPGFPLTSAHLHLCVTQATRLNLGMDPSIPCLSWWHRHPPIRPEATPALHVSSLHPVVGGVLWGLGNPLCPFLSSSLPS